MTERFDALDFEALEAARSLAATLAHDVGKYIARIARNLPAGDLPEGLVKLMEDDLYAIDGERRASAVFEDLAAPLEAQLSDPLLTACRDHLAAIDALETAVRAREPAAVRRAAARALQIEADLAALHRALTEALKAR